MRAREHVKARLEPLMQALGYAFSDPGLLALALLHPSAVPDGARDNQRLEFLGDAALQLCVSDVLYSRYPDKREGDLTQLRAALVREESLARAARDFRLGDYLVMDRGEETTGGRNKPSVLADAMEAVLAAAYLDGGLNAVRAVCDRAYGDYEPTGAMEANWKSLLQEREQALGRRAPEYRLTGESGPPHARAFTAEVLLEDGRRGTGSGPSKKQAEQHAAKTVMEA